MLLVGYENYVSTSKIMAITGASSKPMERLRKVAEEHGKVINCTANRKIRSLIHLDGGYIVLSAIQPETLTERLQQRW